MKSLKIIWCLNIFSSIFLINAISNDPPKETTTNIDQVNANYDNTLNIMHIDDSKNNSLITVPRNSTFQLHVQGNPTTGYGVYLKNYNSIDKTLLRFENLVYDNVTGLYRSDEYIPQNTLNTNTNTNLVGSGGVYVFRITALQDINNILLSFVKIQPWDLKSETGLINLRLTTLTNKISVSQNPNNSMNSGNNVYFDIFSVLFALALLLI